jgi:rubredoxin
MLKLKHVCVICGHVYYEELGDPENGVPAGTAIEELPELWLCPECGAGTSNFVPLK